MTEHSAADVILLVGHGSREAAGNDDIRRFTADWQRAHPGEAVEHCFIEFAEPGLMDGLARAAARARGRAAAPVVRVVPLILNAAGHVKMELPEAVEHARRHHPEVRFDLAPQLGVCDALLAVMRRRLRTAMAELDMPDPTTTGVVLLGRGSSDRGANGEMARMARWLLEVGDHELVDLAFTGITWPRLERVVQRQVLVGMRQIVVLPYYLFDGTLMQRIERQVEHLRQQYPQIRFARADAFGFEPEVHTLVEERVAALRAGAPASALPCDGCRFREIAQETLHGHGHGHAHHHADTPARSDIAALASTHRPTHQAVHTEAVGALQP